MRSLQAYTGGLITNTHLHFVQEEEKTVRIFVLLFLFVATLGHAAAPPNDSSNAVFLKGALARPGQLDAALTRGLPTYRRLVKVAGSDGRYRCTVEVEGYALKDVLDRVQVKKVDDGFNEALDTFITVKGRNGTQILLSYSELYMAGDGGPLLAERAQLLFPHHHMPLEDDSNNPTVMRSIGERGSLSLQSCAACHTGEKLPVLSLPQGWLLVTSPAAAEVRFVEDVNEIMVHQVGILVKDERATTKKTVINEPIIVGPDGKQTALTPQLYRRLPRLAWQDTTIGKGMGFHGYHTWQGTRLDAVLRPLLPAGIALNKTWILVTAADGYRTLFSGSEVFAAPEGKSVLLADRKDGEALGAGSGRYHVVSRTDFFIDRSVRLVKEIRIGVAQ
jgi:DMSO/TMAO reductase YedYZ molybdopterin-dependent catalytic subunit